MRHQSADSYEQDGATIRTEVAPGVRVRSNASHLDLQEWNGLMKVATDLALDHSAVGHRSA